MTNEMVLMYARLKYYRATMNHIHEGGAGRMAAYCLIAKMASEERRALAQLR